jgi:DNA-binding response OmpR family regulator
MTEHKRELLVVDDEASFGRVLKGGLEMHGFTVRYEARSIDTIQARLESHPDLILLDIGMPGKDGGHAASELRSHPTLRHTRVIFLSALVSNEETGKRNASREVLLFKPMPIAELVAKSGEVLQRQTSH